jgi:hypothetical protein
MMIVQKYGTPGGSATAHAALLNDVTAADDTDGMPTLEDCTDEYDDTEVSVPFSSVAFSSSLLPGCDLSLLWVIDFAFSINLTAFRGDFTTFAPHPPPLAWVGSASTLKGSDLVRISVRLAFGQLIHRTVHAMYTPDMSSRSCQRID